MAYTPESRAPLVLYPAVDYISDWNFASGSVAGGLGWVALGGSPPTIHADTSSGVGNYRVNFGFTSSGAGVNSYLQRSPVDPLWIVEQPANGFPFVNPGYAFARVRVNAMPSGGDWLFRVAGYTQSYSANVSPFLFMNVGSGYADGKWRWHRFTMTGNFSTGTAYWTNLAVGYIGQSTPAGVYDIDVAGVYFGHALDLADLGPRADGASFENGHLPLREKNPTAFCELPNGVVESQAWAGSVAGAVDVGPMDDAALAGYKAFVDAVRGNGTAQVQTWMQRRDDLTQHYLPRVANLSRDYGLRKRRDLWTGRVPLRTIP